MTEPWKERQRHWLVQSLNDRKQGTSGCWEWVRERFVFLTVFCFLISSSMGCPCNFFVRGFNNNGNFKTNAVLTFQYFIEHCKLIKLINIRGDLLGNSYCGYLRYHN